MVSIRQRPQTRSKALRRVWSYEDYCAIPEDGCRYEVLWGELLAVPGPERVHQAVLGNLFVLIRSYLKSRNLGNVFVAPFDVVLPLGNTVQPDLLYISEARSSIILEHGVEGAPDLVVEVLSPGTAAKDRSEKWDAYRSAGVPHLWLVSPRARTLEAYKLEGEDYRLVVRFQDRGEFQPELFPGLIIQIEDLWQA